MRKRDEIEIFGLSFMDLISCGLGGVIVIMLIFSSLIRNQQAQSSTKGTLIPFKAIGGSNHNTPEEFNGSYILQIRIPDAPAASTLHLRSTESSLSRPDMWHNFFQNHSTHIVHFRSNEGDSYGKHTFSLEPNGLTSKQPVFVSLFSNGMHEDTLFPGKGKTLVEINRKLKGFEIEFK